MYCILCVNHCSMPKYKFKKKIRDAENRRNPLPNKLLVYYLLIILLYILMKSMVGYHILYIL